MTGGNVNPFSILALVNYWELRPSQIGPRLDEILKRQITQVASFVPWQAIESDISHSLTRFLQAIADRRMNVFLILSPEVGIHYPNSGIPKDIILRKENTAQLNPSGKVTLHLPPNSFSLPSLFAPEFQKRYTSFLARMDSYFGDLYRLHPSLMKYLTVITTGSFWKYYRSAAQSVQSPFSGSIGDYSTHASLAYRQKVESFFSHLEFMEPNPSAANRWKVRSLEETNRKWFYQQAEDSFRTRTRQVIRKKSMASHLEMELFTPEADPSSFYSHFLQTFSGSAADFVKLSAYLDEAASRQSSGPALPFIHWSSMGTFQNMPEAEKQFLLLKSLLLFSRSGGGGILIDEQEWSKFSPQFRNRAENLARTLKHGELQTRNSALYLTPNLWSIDCPLWDELFKRLGSRTKLISHLDLALKDRFAQLLVVDPAYIMTREFIQKIIAWTRAGRWVLLPTSQLYTESAHRELKQTLSHSPGIDVNLGVPYQLHPMGEGKLIVYEASPLASNGREDIAAWKNLIQVVLSFANLDSHFHVTQTNLSVIPFERNQEGLALFLLNGTRRAIQTDLLFPKEVQIEDFGAVFSKPEGREIQKNSIQTNRLSLEIPPCGVMPLFVEGTGIFELREKQLATLSYTETTDLAYTSALNELPGLGSEKGLGDLWN